jgi:hypothetical protein
MTYRRQKRKNNSGFIALISAVIVSAILLLIATTVSNTSFYSGSTILDSELKEKSSALAEACVDKAISKIITDSSYAPPGGGDIVNVGGDECTIQSISGNSTKTIDVRADYRNYVTTLEVQIDSNMSITRFEEK